MNFIFPALSGDRYSNNRSIIIIDQFGTSLHPPTHSSIWCYAAKGHGLHGFLWSAMYWVAWRNAGRCTSHMVLGFDAMAANLFVCFNQGIVSCRLCVRVLCFQLFHSLIILFIDFYFWLTLHTPSPHLNAFDFEIVLINSLITFTKNVLNGFL